MNKTYKLISRNADSHEVDSGVCGGTETLPSKCRPNVGSKRQSLNKEGGAAGLEVVTPASRQTHFVGQGDDTKVLVGAALKYADRYALEAFFRRRTSRVGVSNSRAAWFVRDVPKSMGNAERCFSPDFLRAAPRRMAEGMPSSEALRGSLYGEGYVYQYAARFSSLAFLLVPAWLAPAVSYGNRVMTTEVVARAMEACRRMMGTGPNEKWEVEKYEIDGEPRSFDAVLDSVVGAIVFGIAANQTSDDAGMLQVRLGGAAPNVGGRHIAFPSDCLPRPTRQGFLVIDKEAPPESRVATCEKLASEWKSLDQAFVRGVRTGHPRWVPGCPVRLSCGGVGGNRMLMLTPEPVSREPWLAVTVRHRNVNLASLAEVDKLNDPSESLSQRAKQKSAGGPTAAYSSKNSSPRGVNPVWSSRTART